MPWYKISFPRAEASIRVADLAQDFLDTLQAADFLDGIALYKEKPTVSNDTVVYYVSLNTFRPSRRLTDTYRAEPCPPPAPYTVEHFGGDDTVLKVEMR